MYQKNSSLADSSATHHVTRRSNSQQIKISYKISRQSHRIDVTKAMFDTFFGSVNKKFDFGTLILIFNAKSQVIDFLLLLRSYCLLARIRFVHFGSHLLKSGMSLCSPLRHFVSCRWLQTLVNSWVLCKDLISCHHAIMPSYGWLYGCVTSIWKQES